MCTANSHTILKGRCLCGAIRDEILCDARNPYFSFGPLLWKSSVEGMHVRTNEECLRCEGECTESMYVKDAKST